MFVSITYLPIRAENGAEPESRSLFLTEPEAAADAAAFLALFPDADGIWSRVEPATLDDASEYVERSDESYAECSAEAGMGAVSMGFGVDMALAAANSVSRPDERPLYRAAREMLRAAAPVIVYRCNGCGSPQAGTHNANCPLASDAIPF